MNSSVLLSKALQLNTLHSAHPNGSPTRPPTRHPTRSPTHHHHHHHHSSAPTTIPATIPATISTTHHHPPLIQHQHFEQSGASNSITEATSSASNASIIEPEEEKEPTFGDYSVIIKLDLNAASPLDQGTQLSMKNSIHQKIVEKCGKIADRIDITISVKEDEASPEADGASNETSNEASNEALIVISATEASNEGAEAVG